MNRRLQGYRQSRMRAFCGDTRGSALLEGTVLTPFLCVLLFGVYEFSNFFYQQHLVSTGVRDAARYLARAADPTASSAQTTAQNTPP
jgi:Flp pilus assembly protein TadG